MRHVLQGESSDGGNWPEGIAVGRYFEKRVNEEASPTASKPDAPTVASDPTPRSTTPTEVTANGSGSMDLQ